MLMVTRGILLRTANSWLLRDDEAILPETRDSSLRAIVCYWRRRRFAFVDGRILKYARCGSSRSSDRSNGVEQ